MEILVGAAIIGGATAAVAGGKAFYNKKKRAKIAKRIRSDRDLKVFGVPMSNIVFKADNGLPSVLEECIAYLQAAYHEEPVPGEPNKREEIHNAFHKAEQHGCMTTGVNELINFAEIGEPLELEHYPVSDAVFLLLQYFIELPVSVFPPYLFQDLKNALDETSALQGQSFNNVYKKLPDSSQLVLRRLLPFYSEIFQHFKKTGEKNIFLNAISFSLVTSDTIVENQVNEDPFSVLRNDAPGDSDFSTNSSGGVNLNDDDAIITGADETYTFSDDEEEDVSQWETPQKSVSATPNASFHSSVAPISYSSPQQPSAAPSRALSNPLYQNLSLPSTSCSPSIVPNKPLPSPLSSSSQLPHAPQSFQSVPPLTSCPSTSQNTAPLLSPSASSRNVTSPPLSPTSSSASQSQISGSSTLHTHELPSVQVRHDREAIFNIVETILTMLCGLLEPIEAAEDLIVKPGKKHKKKKKKKEDSHSHSHFHSHSHEKKEKVAKKDKAAKKGKPIDKMKPL